MSEEIDEIKYENFFDVFRIRFKKGMFLLEFGQAIKPEKLKFMVRIWTDPISLKSLFNLLKEMIQRYEKEYGSIE